MNILEFIKKSTDAWHTAEQIKEELNKNGFSELSESDDWKIEEGGKYYVMRNMSSIIAFKVPENPKSFMIVAAHSDSPCLKIKPSVQTEDKEYIKLDIESYGGQILSTWLDRPLSVSGRIVADTKDGIEMRLVNLEDAAVIPSIAPHLNRDNKELNILKDMPPMYALSKSKRDFMTEIAENAGVKKEQIKGFDLMVYNNQDGVIWGDDFISAPRLDDLQCVYGAMQGFLEGENSGTAQVLCVLDNEEVGSGTKQGAKSDFLASTLIRISESMGKSYSDYMKLLSSSFMVSADNAHAVHPNRTEMSDKQNYPILNGGIVIKHNASQKYTTDAVSDAIFKKICEMADVPYQVYANRSDLQGGSTLGNLACEKVSVNTVDIGLSQLAMHSAFETAGNKDTQYLIKAIKKFYETKLEWINGKISFTN